MSERKREQDIHTSYEPMKIALKQFMSSYLRMTKRIEGIRNALITDQATGAGDYSEAEEYANRIVGTPEKNPMEYIEDKSWARLLLDEVAECKREEEIRHKVHSLILYTKHWPECSAAEIACSCGLSQLKHTVERLVGLAQLAPKGEGK